MKHDVFKARTAEEKRQDHEMKVASLITIQYIRFILSLSTVK